MLLMAKQRETHLQIDSEHRRWQACIVYFQLCKLYILSVQTKTKSSTIKNSLATWINIHIAPEHEASIWNLVNKEILRRKNRRSDFNPKLFY